ncbi:MAG: FG-GAP-like repeat-containing protein [Rhodothermales bacterium]
MRTWFRLQNVTHLALLLSLSLLLAACEKPALPDTSSAAYKEAVKAFFSSTASIQSGEDVGAENNLIRVAELAPGEPAAWYNLALLSLRQNDFDTAGERLAKAIALAPDNGEILRLLGVMEITMGNTAEGIAHLNQSVLSNPADYKARYALAQERVRSGDPAQLEAAAELYAALANDLPENLVVQLEKARLAAQRNDTVSLQEATEVLGNYAPEWSEDIQEPFDALQSASATNDVTQAGMQAGFLRNMLLSTYDFRQDLLEVQTPTEKVGDLMTSFVLLPAPTAQPAPADAGLTYTASSSEVGPVVDGAVQARAEPLSGEEGYGWVSHSSSEAMVNEQPFAFDVASLVTLDHNYDFLIDVVLAGSNGIQLLEQDSTGQFTPRAAAAQFGAAAAQSYTGAWVADVDLEGDLDLVLAGENGPIILRNNGDNTFASLALFDDVQQLTDFAWGDFDGDGDPDPALLDAAGELYLYANERMGLYIRQIVPPIFGNAIALGVADPNADALMDLVVLMDDGAVYTVANQPGEGWVVSQLVKWDAFRTPAVGKAAIFLGDYDNNGATDVVISGEESLVWLQNDANAFEALAANIAGTVQSVTDLDSDGLLDFAGVDLAGAPATWKAQGTQDYHWQVLRPRAGQALGDQRINSFAVGGEVEIRAGLLYQKQPILSPVVHLGLGTHEQTDVARLIWPNGDIQSEFELAADQSIFTPQRLKGSCPWLFTFDGERMRFVTDFIWRSPLGLRINAQETAGTVTTEDWVKIRGEELVPRDGVYDLRITAELWETHFFDHVSLLAVDHPVGTEIFIDERFSFPAPEMKVHHTSAVQPLKTLTTDNGRDETATVSARDGQYLDFFGRGQYQGITRDHYIDIELGDEVLTASDPMLVAFGWVRPTDSSINVAISQGRQAAPRGLSLEVLQEDGSWRMVNDNLGFPAGKTKTVLIDLKDAFDGEAKPVLRLRTNLEIYWDEIGWATKSSAEININEVPLQSSALTYRGFSHVAAADASSPELPDYQILEGTGARWRDLVGYYTRFGPIEELLEQTDDRYAILNAGDEIRFLFEAQPPPPEGWQRDFVLVGDGWVKDGDYNTAFSKTVRPLPTHKNPSYDTAPTTLAEDPVYQQHKADWQTYHTRYVEADAFRKVLAVEK